mmetsp:Transcript_96574/g.273003  ORF Transcript_96574/g.273003 Transcript_96574/m.273003 type:complete len:1026 (+) Transcript_96574:134-3211(+)
MSPGPQRHEKWMNMADQFEVPDEWWYSRKPLIGPAGSSPSAAHKPPSRSDATPPWGTSPVSPLLRRNAASKLCPRTSSPGLPPSRNRVAAESSVLSAPSTPTQSKEPEQTRRWRSATQLCASVNKEWHRPAPRVVARVSAEEEAAVCEKALSNAPSFGGFIVRVGTTRRRSSGQCIPSPPKPLPQPQDATPEIDAGPLAPEEPPDSEEAFGLSVLAGRNAARPGVASPDKVVFDADGASFEESGAQTMLAKWLDSTDFSVRVADRVQRPYCHARPCWATPVAASVQQPAERDGTVGPEPPRSPPVVGRCVNTHLEASMIDKGRSGPSTLILPRLQRDASVWARAPWPPEGGAGPGLKAQVAEAAVSEAPSVFVFLRSHFADVDVDNDRQVTEKELVTFVLNRTRRLCDWQQVPQEFERLLTESALRCYHQAVVRDDGIRVEDWVHFGLLLISAPSHLAHHLLNQRLRRVLRQNPFLLKEILHSFEEADVRGAGVLQLQDIRATFINGDAFVKDMGVGSGDQVAYYDFVAHCLGYRRSEVVLNWYDVSHGFAQWVPPAMLGGQRFGGVWHTGVVAFGREYWYGGKVLSSEPGQAPFPPGPVKCTVVGTTLRTKEELEEFLRFELAPRYTRDNYDILRNNCNHFSDEVTAFLIQGAHIPDEARLQPEALMNTPLFEGLRPYLNHWLGGFEATGSGAEIDDLMTEWRARLWPGDLALYVHQSQLHEPIRLVHVSNVDAWRGVCDISFFESDSGAIWQRAEGTGCTPGARVHAPRNGCDIRVLRLGSCVDSGSFWDWKLQHRATVTLTSLRPCTRSGRGLAGSIGAGLGCITRAGLKSSNPELLNHLQRKAIVYAHCPRGHVMRTVQPDKATRSWDLVALALTCGICERSISRKEESRLECPACVFHLCNACDRKGLFRGYYSLGSIDMATSSLLIQEHAWVRYKALRYMAAAGAAGVLSLEAWQQKVAVRLYADLGIDLAPPSELIELYRRFCKGTTGTWGGLDGLDAGRFADLLMELLALQASVVTL